MKRIATITENGNAQLNFVMGFGNWIEQPTAIIGPVHSVELIGDKFLISATNGCSIWADEIRREE